LALKKDAASGRAARHNEKAVRGTIMQGARFLGRRGSGWAKKKGADRLRRYQGKNNGGSNMRGRKTEESCSGGWEKGWPKRKLGLGVR